MDERLKNREIKVCPVVLRHVNDNIELLLFTHPLADIQLVKGTLEITDESLERAALRELEEESGISTTSAVKYLASWESGYNNQLWHFVLCEVPFNLPDSWSFYTQDDGGHDFKFFWHKLGCPLNFKCHKLFSDVIKQIEVMCLL